MDEAKKVSIQNIVDREIKKFADSYEARFTNEVNDPEGVINSKKNNCFVAELGKEFMFYSAFVRSFEKSHVTDHYFYNNEKNEHYLIELKAGGDLDNKKAKTEKLAMLQEYFILKNSLRDKPNDKIKLFLGTAYNKYGENSEWKQERVKQFFAEDELLIGKDYWNFVCDDPEGFNIVFEQYKKSSEYIKEALERIKVLYFK